MKKLLMAAVVAGLMTTLSASAGSMLFDLGAMDGDMDNSPAIATGAVPAGSMWNQVSKATGESPAPLWYADGSIAVPTEATVRTYRNSNAVPPVIVGWSTLGGNGADNVSADRSGIFSGPGGTCMHGWQSTAGLGVILPAGTYTVYVSAVNYNGGGLYMGGNGIGLPVDVYIGTAPANNADITLPNMPQLTMETLEHTNYATWQAGDNFAVGQVTSDGIDRIIVGTHVLGGQGLISSVEFVIPEPATMALLGLGSLVMLRRRK